jgi:hypothetical protein
MNITRKTEDQLIVNQQDLIELTALYRNEMVDFQVGKVLFDTVKQVIGVQANSFEYSFTREVTEQSKNNDVRTSAAYIRQCHCVAILSTKMEIASTQCGKSTRTGLAMTEGL